MKKLIIILNVVILLSVSPLIFAEASSQKKSFTSVSFDPSIYLGIQAGWGLTNYKNNAAVTALAKVNFPGANPEVNGDDGLVIRLFLGYDINKYLATEVGHSYFYNNVKVAWSPFCYVRTRAFDLYVKGKLPIVHNLDLYAKVGVGLLMPSKQATNVNVAFGVGADYYVTPHVVANLEWSRIAGCQKYGDDYIPNTDAFMVGLKYKF